MTVRHRDAMRKALVTILLLTLSSSASYAATPTAKEEYELQERCGKRAEEVFKREFGNGISNTEDGQSMAGYTNHYNKKLNKCFYLLAYTEFRYKNKKEGSSTLITLFDINEQREYGQFFSRLNDKFGFQCKVEDKACSSQAEWEALIKPYMND